MIGFAIASVIIGGFMIFTQKPFIALSIILFITSVYSIFVNIILCFYPKSFQQAINYFIQIVQNITRYFAIVKDNLRVIWALCVLCIRFYSRTQRTLTQLPPGKFTHYVSHLPEVFHLIMSELDFRSQIRLSLTCKSCYQNLYITRFSSRDKKFFHNLGFHQLFLSRYSRLEVVPPHLQFKLIDYKSYLKSLRQTPRVTSLHLTESTPLFTSLHQKVLSKVTTLKLYQNANLEFIDPIKITSLNSNFNIVNCDYVISFVNLTRLSLRFHSSTLEYQFLENLVNLERLSFCKFRFDSSIHDSSNQPVIPYLPKLRNLKTSIMRFKKMPLLESVKLVCTYQNIDTESLDNLSPSCRLNAHVTSMVPNNNFNYEYLETCKNLVEYSFIDCSYQCNRLPDTLQVLYANSDISQSAIASLTNLRYFQTRSPRINDISHLTKLTDFVYSNYSLLPTICPSKLPVSLTRLEMNINFSMVNIMHLTNLTKLKLPMNIFGTMQFRLLKWLPLQEISSSNMYATELREYLPNSASAIACNDDFVI